MKQTLFSRGMKGLVLGLCALTGAVFAASAQARSQFHDFRVNNDIQATITYGGALYFSIKAEGTTFIFPIPAWGSVYFGYGAQDTSTNLPANVICSAELGERSGDVLTGRCSVAVSELGAGTTYDIWVTRKDSTSWLAHYNDWWSTEPDRNYAGSPSTIPVTVNKATPTLGSTVPGSVAVNTAFDLSVAFSGNPLISNITGTVTFKTGGTTLCTVTKAAGSAAASCTVSATALAAGTYPVTVEYGGDGNFNAVGPQDAGSIIVQANAPTVTLAAVPPSPVTLGTSFVLTATLTNGANPTGTVDFTSGSTVVCNGVAVGGTQAICTVSTPWAVGTYQITAAYSGDSFNDPASGQIAFEIQKAAPTLSLSSSAASIDYSAPITFTADLGGEIQNFALHTVVDFRSDGSVITGCDDMPIIAGTLTTCTVPGGTLAPGSAVTLTARTEATANYDTVTSNDVTLTVDKASPDISFITNPSPVYDDTASIDIIAQLPPIVGVTPAGTVDFVVDGTASCIGVAVVADPDTGVGTAACTITGPLATGPHSLDLAFTVDPASTSFVSGELLGQSFTVMARAAATTAIPATSTGVLLLIGLSAAMLGGAVIRRRRE